MPWYTLNEIILKSRKRLQRKWRVGIRVGGNLVKLGHCGLQDYLYIFLIFAFT